MSKTILQLPSAAAAAFTQLFEVVTNPSTTPASESLALSQIKTLLDTVYPTKPVSVPNGGTGLTSVVADQVLIGNGTSPFLSYGTFVYDGTNLQLISSNLLIAGGDLNVDNSAISVATSATGGVGGSPALIVVNTSSGGLFSGLLFQNTGARQTAFAFQTNTSGSLNNNYSMGVDLTDTGSSNFFLYDQIGTQSCFVVDSGRRMGLRGITSPTAGLHLPVGLNTASGAPLKFSSGTNLTTAEAGAMEYNGTNLFFTRAGTVRENVICSSAKTTEVLVTDTSVTINLNGVTLKLLAKA